MRLDYDLIRSIILDVENETDGHGNIDPALFAKKYFPQYDEEIVLYHIQYLKNAALIEPQTGYEFIDLTPKVHEFINNIRSNSIWEATKEKAYSCATSISLSLLVELAKQAASSAIGL